MEQTANPKPQAGGTTLILIALGMAVVAMIINTIYIEAAKMKSQESTFSVYTLTRNVSPNDPLGDADLREIKVPMSFHDSFALLDAIGKDQYATFMLNKETRFQIYARDKAVVTRSMFLKPDDRQIVQSGKVQISLPINSVIQPGTLKLNDRVNILGQFTIDGNTQLLTVMEQVEVMAMDRITADPNKSAGSSRNVGNYRAITVQVTNDEAKQLIELQQLAHGDFILALRAQGDAAFEVKSGSVNPLLVKMLANRRGQR